MAKPNVWWPLKSIYVTGAWANSPAYYAKYGQKGHNGLDLRAAVGTPVYAADDGTVRFEGWGKNFSWMGSVAGICIVLKHSWGHTGYAHLSRTVINNGQTVKRGQLIGYSGATGGVTGAHLHFETLPLSPNFGNGFAGRVDPPTIATFHAYGWAGETPVAANQRKVDPSGVNIRTSATSKSAVAKKLAGGTVVTPDGWVTGEKVDNISIWYKTNGGYAWAGGFTVENTSGLKDLNPVPADQRTVDPTTVNVREAPTSGSTLVTKLAANSKVTPLGWITGEAVQGISVWYKLTNGYAWAGGFTKEDTSGLKDLNPVSPSPEPNPDPQPTDVGPAPVLDKITGWNSVSAPEFGTIFRKPAAPGPKLKLPVTIEEREQLPEGGYYEGREGIPNHIVLHHGAQPKLPGLLATLSGKDDSVPTANYAVKDNILVAMVPETDSPATNGRWKSNTYSITLEICNDQTTTDKPSEASHETAAWAVARAAVRWGMKTPLVHGETVFGHKEVSKSPTSCPLLLDVDWIIRRANAIIESNGSVPIPPSENESHLEETLNKLMGMLTDIYNLED